MCSKCSRELQAAAKRGTAASKTFDSFAPASGAQASPVHSPQSAFEDTAAASASVAQLPAPASVAQPAPSAVQQVISVTEVVASPTQAQPLLAADGPAGERPVQKSTSRCFSCKKKVSPNSLPLTPSTHHIGSKIARFTSISSKTLSSDLMTVLYHDRYGLPSELKQYSYIYLHLSNHSQGRYVCTDRINRLQMPLRLCVLRQPPFGRSTHVRL